MTPDAPTPPTKPATDVSRRRRRLRKAAVMLMAYLCGTLLIVFGGCADRLILFPSTEPIREPGITRIEVPAYAGGKPVEVWTARSRGARANASEAEPQAYCLEFVGNASRAEW